jgi:hypothetical protein
MKGVMGMHVGAATARATQLGQNSWLDLCAPYIPRSCTPGPPPRIRSGMIQRTMLPYVVSWSSTELR